VYCCSDTPKIDSSEPLRRSGDFQDVVQAWFPIVCGCGSLWKSGSSDDEMRLGVHDRLTSLQRIRLH
jgi:hypothetical protein